MKKICFILKQIEEWEKEVDISDRSRVIWSKSKSKDNIQEEQHPKDNIQESKDSISNLTSKIEKKNLEEKDLAEISKVQEYSRSFKTLFNKGENRKNLEAYKNSVLNLLKIKQMQKDSASIVKLLKVEKFK